MGFSRQKDRSELLCPPQGDVPTPGSKPRLLHSGWIPLASEPPVKHQVLLNPDKMPRQPKDGTCCYLLWPTWAHPSCPEVEFTANVFCFWYFFCFYSTVFCSFYLVKLCLCSLSMVSSHFGPSYSSTCSSTPSKFSGGH